MTQQRPSSEEMDCLLGHEFRVLDHGLVRVVDYMGNDAAVVQAARTSYGAGTKTVNEDQGLINYLMRNRHTTPFEMCEIKLHCKMPIFVARQWIRHRTASVNEMSARYSILADEFYIPEMEHMAVQSSTNRQGRGALLSDEDAEHTRGVLNYMSETAFGIYHSLLNEDSDGNEITPDKPHLARELSRMVLPLNTYTEWYWKVDLHNLLHFLQLRADPHAQYEIRVYADVLLGILELWVPMTYEAFKKYRLEAKTFSAVEMKILKSLVTDELLGGIDPDKFGITRGEFREFLNKLRSIPDGTHST